MSAASFLGIAGLIALYGYDGFLYSIGFLVAWLVALLLVAELLRNSGRYTMADVLAFRMRQRPVRTAAAISTVVVSIFYLLAQMVGAGALVALLLGADSRGREDRHDHPRRRADDLLRHRRRHEGHHLGADRQGVPADGRRHADDRAGAGEVQLQPVRPARRRRRQHAARARRSSSPACGTASTRPRRRSTSSPRPRAGARHRRPAAHPDPLLHGADRQGRPEVRALGDRHHRHLLPDDAGARLRRGGAGRRRADTPRSRPRAATPPRHCSPRPSAAATVRPAARCCWRSSRRSRSRRSSPWSPG